MSRISRVLSLFVITIFLFSCATRSISVEIMRPAEITLPGTIKRIGIIDRSTMTPSQFNEYYKNRGIIKRYPDVLKLGAKSALDAYIDKMNGFGRFEIIRIAKPDSSQKSGFIAKTAEWNYLKKLANENKVEAIVSLEGIDMDLYSDYKETTTTLTDSIGNTYTVPRYASDRQFNIITSWRIYNCNSSVITSEKTEKADLYIFSNSWCEDKDYQSIPNVSGTVENAAQAVGIKYSKHIIPNWEKVTRKYYIGNTENWLDAADSAEVRNWPSAEEQWIILGKKTKLGIFKYHAYYNLALASEMREDFEKALQYAQNGYRFRKSKEMAEYIQILKDRVSESELLDIQFGQKK